MEDNDNVPTIREALEGRLFNTTDEFREAIELEAWQRDFKATTSTGNGRSLKMWCSFGGEF